MIETKAVLRSGADAAEEVGAALRLFGQRGWTLAAAGAIGTLLTIGVLAAVVDNPLFGRPLEVRGQDYAIWGTTALLSGLIIGTYAKAGQGNEGKALSGGFLSYVAVGCPVCNKIAVGLLGTSGALTFFAPAQLYLGIGSLLLLGWTLRLRARSVVVVCRVRS